MIRLATGMHDENLIFKGHMKHPNVVITQTNCNSKNTLVRAIHEEICNKTFISESELYQKILVFGLSLSCIYRNNRVLVD